MAHDLPRDARLLIDDGRGCFVPVITIHGNIDAATVPELLRAMRRHADSVARQKYGQSLESILDMHQRHDVGHELVLAERARSDHR